MIKRQEDNSDNISDESSLMITKAEKTRQGKIMIMCVHIFKRFYNLSTLIFYFINFYLLFTTFVTCMGF